MKWQLIALWWLLITCLSSTPKCCRIRRRWRKADFTSWWHCWCWRHFKKMYFSKEHPPGLLFVQYVMGLGICLVQNYAKLPLIPAEAGARLDSHILEVVVYSSRKKNAKATNNFGYLLKDLICFLHGMCHRFALFSRFPLLLLTAPPRCFVAWLLQVFACSS